MHRHRLGKVTAYKHAGKTVLKTKTKRRKQFRTDQQKAAGGTLKFGRYMPPKIKLGDVEKRRFNQEWPIPARLIRNGTQTWDIVHKVKARFYEADVAYFIPNTWVSRVQILNFQIFAPAVPGFSISVFVPANSNYNTRGNEIQMESTNSMRRASIKYILPSAISDKWLDRDDLLTVIRNNQSLLFDIIVSDSGEREKGATNINDRQLYANKILIYCHHAYSSLTLYLLKYHPERQSMGTR